MRPRWRKVIHDLIDNKSRTVLVVLSIAVGVFSIGVIAGTFMIISNDMSKGYAANNPMNIEIRGEGFSESQVSLVANMRGIEDAEGRRVVNMRARIPGSSRWQTLNFVAINDFAKSNINHLTLMQGSPDPRKEEVLLEKKAYEQLQIEPGQSLEVQLNNDQIKTLTVVGVVQDPSTGAGDFLASPFAYISTDTLNLINEPGVYNRIFATVSEGKNETDHLLQMTTEVKDKLEKNRAIILQTSYSKTNEHPLASTVQAILGILMALGILILFLSGSLIANTLSALLNQHMRHIGVIKLVGGSRKQIIAMYLVLILAFSLIALVIAIPLGGQGAYILAKFIADKLNFQLLGYRIVPIALIIQIFVGLGIPLLAGLAPVINGSRTTVLRALNGDSGNDRKPKHLKDEAGQASLWERFQVRATHWLAKRGIHIPRPVLISLRNTFRRKSRLILTLFTLTMSGAIFIAVFNVRASLNDYIDQIGHYFIADVTMDFEQPYRIEKVNNTAMQVPGVEYVEGWAFASGEILKPDGSVAENLSILAPPVESNLVQPDLISGRWLQPGDEKVITLSDSILSALPDLEPGQKIRLKVNGKEDEWTVAGIFRFVHQEGTIAYTTYEYLSKYTKIANKSFSYRFITDQHTPAYQAIMAEKLDNYFLEQGYKVSQTRTGESTLASAAESLGILVTFLLIMALLTALVGSMGLTGTMSMNVFERTREIGIMRSIGAVDTVIMRTVISEGVVIGAISWGLGAVLSIPFSYLLSAILSTAIFNFLIPVKFTFMGFIIWLLVVLALAAVASVIPARKAARLTIREVLSYE
jgi:putative ABC transport system permease protein